ncbi:MAG: KEOPS complex subunit Cgi121 [Thermoplasmatota archaeon]
MPREIVLYLFRAEKGLDPKEIDQVLDCVDSPGPVVLVDRDSVFGPLHLSSAVMQAARSIIDGSGRARDPSIEVLRWISGTHQVSKAIETAGAGKDTRSLLAVCLPGEWPSIDDARSLLDVVVHPWETDLPRRLSDLGDELPYGGRRALKKLGIDLSDDVDDREAEMMVLESICSPSLRGS